MTWSAPSGPQPVTDYDYRYRARILDGEWMEVTNTIVTATQVELDLLTPGTTYDVQVRAVNQGGPSEWSGTNSAQTLFPPTPTPVAGAQLLTFSDPGTETASLQIAIARTILEYGYQYRTRTVAGTETQAIQNLGNGLTNIHMEVRLPAFQSAWDDVFDVDTILTLGDSFAGVVSQSAFLIPQYTANANPALFRVQGLQESQHKQLFAGPDGGKARLITCVTEWECARINEKQVHGYGLDEHVELVDPRTPEALYNLIISAFENQEHILFYYWWPSALATTLEGLGGFEPLREPSWGQGCWDRLTSTVAASQITQACAYPDSSSLIAVRKDVEEFSPDVVEFLKDWTLDREELNELLGYKERFRFFVLQESEYREAAFTWLRNSDEWQSWVATGIAQRVLDGIGR